MIRILSISLVLAAFTLAHPFSLSHPLHPRAVTPRASIKEEIPGTCQHTHLPTEEEYNLGTKTFCEAYLPPEDFKVVFTSDPLDATVNLTAYDGNPIRWVYKVTNDDYNERYQYRLTRDVCMKRFRAVLEGEAGMGGNVVGKNYCVVEGTGGGDEESGQGDVLVMGGWVTEVVNKDLPKTVGKIDIFFETRERLDD